MHEGCASNVRIEQASTAQGDVRRVSPPRPEPLPGALEVPRGPYALLAGQAELAARVALERLDRELERSVDRAEPGVERGEPPRLDHRSPQLRAVGHASPLARGALPPHQ